MNDKTLEFIKTCFEVSKLLNVCDFNLHESDDYISSDFKVRNLKGNYIAQLEKIISNYEHVIYAENDKLVINIIHFY